METHNYQIGIEINTRHINAVLVFQQNKQWKISAFWQFPLPLNDDLNDTYLRKILIDWRKKLPSINNVTLSLPDIYESYQTIPLPHAVSLTSAACYRLAQLRATSYTQNTKIPVNFDYRQNKGKLAIHLCHKTILEKYIDLFSRINLTITAIDIPACALRYLATYLDISPQAPLLYCKNKTLFWVSSDDNMPHYGTLIYENQQEQQACIYQLIEKYHWSLKQCYLTGDNEEYFRQLMPIFPNFSHDLFKTISDKALIPLVALGLALRPEEVLCIK
ncbi:hypothetical protein NA898_11975 [Proteus cibi]|uniref:Pilus assembly protein PilM n=1 Tax=Proteus cibi TaxID=2050966 RepID=A0ABU6EFU4_9GAMM|nr:hypothetical protein [Proteus cibi]EST57312.1 hypothetical protein K151_2710 [Proteus hauseri ZMd44]MEB6857961.1 hypothetical protein [Proteus cibi]MEB7089263.1 hypothetical protein [Proteus cibi]